MAQSQPPADPNRAKRLNAILAEYLKRKDAGQPVSEEALLQAYPDLADGLSSYFQGEAMMGGVAGVAVAETVQPRPMPQSMASNVRETVKPGGGSSDTSSEFRTRSFGRYKLLRPLDEGAMGTASEYIEGISAVELIRQIGIVGMLPPEKVLGIAIDLCAALQFAETNDIIHRNIRPSNTLI